MSNPLMGSLGLDSVEADPNYLADGPYKGVVKKSEIVVTKKDEVNHVITYQVTEGPRKGAQKAEWFKLGIDPKYDDGPSKKLIGFTPTMTEAAKPWYKKRWVDLGVPEAEVSTSDFSRLVGVEVDFGIKTNDGFKNISYVNKRDESTPVVAASGPAGVL